MYKFSKKLSLATLALTLATNLAQATAVTVETPTPAPVHPHHDREGWNSPKQQVNGGSEWHPREHEHHPGRGSKELVSKPGLGGVRTSARHRFWIHEHHKRDFYDQWAGDFGLRGEYNTGSFRKFQDQLRRCASEYATVSFTRPIAFDGVIEYQGEAAFTDESVSVYYNLPRKLCWKVNRKGKIIEMHRLRPEELRKLVQDLIEDKDSRAIIDLLRTVRYLSIEDQRKVCDHVSKKLDNPDWIKENDFYRVFSPEQVSKIHDCLRRLKRAGEPERSRIYDELDGICKNGWQKTGGTPPTKNPTA